VARDDQQDVQAQGQRFRRFSWPFFEEFCRDAISRRTK
jgi:hypothetical protein